MLQVASGEEIRVEGTVVDGEPTSTSRCHRWSGNRASWPRETW